MDHEVLDCWESRNKKLRFVDKLWDNKRGLKRFSKVRNLDLTQYTRITVSWVPEVISFRESREN